MKLHSFSDSADPELVECFREAQRNPTWRKALDFGKSTLNPTYENFVCSLKWKNRSGFAV